MVLFAFKHLSLKFKLFKHRICIVYTFFVIAAKRVALQNSLKHHIDVFDANIPHTNLSLLYMLIQVRKKYYTTFSRKCSGK